MLPHNRLVRDIENYGPRILRASARRNTGTDARERFDAWTMPEER
jgi:hypothetical protein